MALIAADLASKRAYELRPRLWALAPKLGVVSIVIPLTCTH
jgi:hypothetical protein